MSTASLQQGFAALQSGDAEAALEIGRAHKADPNGQYLEGLALRALGRSLDALAVFDALASAQPQVLDFANLAALCRADLGETDTAIAGFEAILARNPGFQHAAFNLGRTLAEVGRMDEAIPAYQRALKINPNHLASRRNLAWCLEQRHQIELAEQEADTVLAAQPGDPLSLSVKATALIQRGEFDAAAALISMWLPGDAPAVNAALALGKKGEALEKAGQFSAAFEAWAEANSRLKAHFSPAFDAVEGGFSLAHVKRLNDWPLTELSAVQDNAPSPVFLVGFPRSGTTLMESVLAAHPDITTSDERPLSTPLIEAAGTTEARWKTLLDNLPAQREELQADYWSGWPDGAPQQDQVFIDKLPLNLPFVGLLASVFPSARFILALRDPRDCVLSAFKQRFGMNPAMYRMLSLDDAAAYYDAAMSAGVRALDALPDNRVIQVRYEDCVDDLEREARRLIEFLSLEWSDDVLAYRDRAKKREISTPSAPQVVQPIYKSSAGRWRDYAKELAPVLPVLNPWAERWGYDPN